MIQDKFRWTDTGFTRDILPFQSPDSVFINSSDGGMSMFSVDGNTPFVLSIVDIAIESPVGSSINTRIQLPHATPALIKTNLTINYSANRYHVPLHKRRTPH